MNFFHLINTVNICTKWIGVFFAFPYLWHCVKSKTRPTDLLFQLYLFYINLPQHKLGQQPRWKPFWPFELLCLCTSQLGEVKCNHVFWALPLEPFSGLTSSLAPAVLLLETECVRRNEIILLSFPMVTFCPCLSLHNCSFCLLYLEYPWQ